MRILLTAFEPFGGETINPALMVIGKLPDTLGNIEITKMTLPVEFGRSAEMLIGALDKGNFDAAVMLGQAGGRVGITIERVGINLDEADIKDNAGKQPKDKPIVKDGPAAYFSSLPIKKMVNAIIKKGIPAAISNTAGTFVCNHVLYQALHHINQTQSQTKACFIHLPFLPQQAVGDKDLMPVMELDMQVEGILAAIQKLDHP